jgi:TetR/AcrR family transcriptional regulator
MRQIVKSPRTKRRGIQRDKALSILNAARSRFARFGFSKVTMEEIAEDIGVVKGAVYYYFPTKERIFEAVIREEQGAFIAEIEELIKAPLRIREKVIRYMQKRQLYVRRLIALGQLDYEAWRKLKPYFQNLLQDFDRREWLLLQHILEQGIASGEFAITDAHEYARLFLRTLRGLRVLDAVYGNTGRRESIRLDQEIRLFTSVFLEGIQNSKWRKKSL